jgi:hypothetical protein
LGFIVFILFWIYLYYDHFRNLSVYGRFRFDGVKICPTRLVERGGFKAWREFKLGDVVGVEINIDKSVPDIEDYEIDMHLPEGTVVRVNSFDVVTQSSSAQAAYQSLSNLCSALLTRFDTVVLRNAITSLSHTISRLEEDGDEIDRNHGFAIGAAIGTIAVVFAVLVLMDHAIAGLVVLTVSVLSLVMAIVLIRRNKRIYGESVK